MEVGHSVDADPLPHDPSAVGRATHRVLARGERNPSRQDVQAEARSEEAAGQPHVYGIAGDIKLVLLRLEVPDRVSPFTRGLHPVLRRKGNRPRKHIEVHRARVAARC